MICSFKRLIYPKSTREAEAGGYMVAAYNVHGKMVDADGNRVYEAKAVGYYLPITFGLRFEITGHWSKTKYGMQFEVESFREIVQPTKAGIVAYLASGLIKGIGEKTAERIYSAFGAKTLKVLDKRPEELLTIRGISQAKLGRIRDSYMESRAARDVVSLLAPHGVSANRAVQIFKRFGANAAQIIRTHPYRLCDMHGIGFLTADAIAKSMGLAPLSPERIAAGLLYALKEAETRGHLCLEKNAFIQAGIELLDTDGLTAEMATREACQMLKRGELVTYQGQAYRAAVAETEQLVADKVRQILACGEIKYDIDLDEAIDREQVKLGVTLAAEQRQAIKTCLTSRLCIVSGGPGTGKTMIQRILLEIYRQANEKAEIVCCAPTGRAARRMAQCAGYAASTIHKALGLTAGDDGSGNGAHNSGSYDGYGEPGTLTADLVLVDEVSMLDIYLARQLLGALPEKCQLVLVGDADQLPSVGPGAVLSEFIVCGLIPVVKLDRVFRQDAGSLIAVNAKKIRHGETTLDYGGDFVFRDSDNCEQSASLIERLYLHEVNRIGLDNVALLTPYRKKTETGVNALNERLRERLNPPDHSKPEVSWDKRLFRLGDKVMQIKNHGDVSNGDIGYIIAINTTDDDTAVRVDFGDGRIAEYEQQELELLDLAYACTVHKSQGSEYQSVIAI